MTEWRDHLEILGPDLSVWPPRLAEEAIALMSVSREAQDIFAVASGAPAQDVIAPDRPAVR